MDYIIIGGRKYDDIVVGVTRQFDILHTDNSGRTATIGARMSLDPLGTFYTYTLKFKRKSGKEILFDYLWDFLSQPRTDGVPVTLVYNQETITFDAYISTGSQELVGINKRTGLVTWDTLEVQITPMEANIKP